MIPKRIVAIGTSAFFGDGDFLHGGYIGRLKVWHESNNPDNYVFNLGITLDKIGETTESLLKRIVPEASIREPNLILLTSGINDIRRPESKENPSAVSPEQFEKNIHEMIAKAQFVVKDVMLVSVFPIKEKHDRSNNYLLPEDLTVYAVIVKKVCEEENIPYMDLYNEWLGKNYEQFLSLDGVHINTKGHEMIFEKLKEFLEKMYS